MPAPLDWSAAGGIEAVKLLVKTMGVRPAARALNLSAAHGAALRQLCHRGGWLVSPQPVAASPHVVQSVTNTPGVVTRTVSTLSAPLSPTVSPPTVLTAAEAFDAEMRDCGSESRLLTARRGRDSLRLAAKKPKLSDSADVLATCKTLVSAKVPGWEAEQQAAGGPLLVNLDLRGMLDRVAPKAIEAEVLEN